MIVYHYMDKPVRVGLRFLLSYFIFNVIFIAIFFFYLRNFVYRSLQLKAEWYRYIPNFISIFQTRVKVHGGGGI